MNDSGSSAQDECDGYKPPQSRGKDKAPLDVGIRQTCSNSTPTPSYSAVVEPPDKATSLSKQCSRRKKNVLNFPTLSTNSTTNETSLSPAGSSPVNIPSNPRLPDVDLSYSPTSSKPPPQPTRLPSLTPFLTSLMHAPSESQDDDPARLFTRSATTLDLFVEDLGLSLDQFHSCNFNPRTLIIDCGFHIELLRTRTPRYSCAVGSSPH